MKVLHKLAKKPNEKLGNTMWVLWGGNVATCSLMILDVSIAMSIKRNNENFGRLMHVLQGKKSIKCNMEYPYACITCTNKHYVYC
jgi:hypothetical protein